MDYGNVPETDIDAMENAALSAAQVLARLPDAMPQAWQNYAYEQILNALLSDWIDNAANDWDEEDEENLANLALAAYNISMEQDEAFQETAFRALLKNAMGDWVENW